MTEDRLALPSVARRIVDEHGFRLRKSLGQNFLIDENTLQRIVGAVELAPTDHVLEIGPGLGTMTQALAEQAADVTSIEIDKMLIPILQETLAAYPNARIIHADALKVDLGEIYPARETIKVAANLPYYITTPLILKLLTSPVPWSLMVFLIQKEVGDRLLATPGSDEYGHLTVIAQALGEVELVTKVPKTVFLPPPQVDSVVIRIRYGHGRKVADLNWFELTSRAIFGQRRKTLSNALSTSPHWRVSGETVTDVLASLKIDPKRRGETLSVDEIITLSNALAKHQQP